MITGGSFIGNAIPYFRNYGNR